MQVATWVGNLDLPATPASDLIDGLDAIETDLTAHLTQLYIDLGLATPPCKAIPAAAGCFEQ